MVPLWGRSEKSLAWLGLIYIILTPALALGSEHQKGLVQKHQGHLRSILS